MSVARELRRGVDGTGQEAPAQRAERDEADTQLRERWQHRRLDAAAPQRVLALHRADGLDRVRATDGLRGSFRQPEMAHLACGDEVLHGASDLLDGHIRVDPVLVEEVDGVDAEAP